MSAIQGLCRRAGRRGALALLMLAFIGRAAMAADFSVFPMSPDFGQRNSSSFVIANQSASPLRAQIRVFAWTQSGGRDIDSPTEEMIASPPFVELGGKDNQTVRLLYRGKVPVDAPRAFHVVVSELPELADTSPRRGRTLNTVISFSMPVYLEPQGAEAALSAALIRGAGNSGAVILSNGGTRRATIKSATVQKAGGQLALARLPATLLPGSSIEIPVQDPALFAAGFTIRVATEERSFDVPVSLR